MCWAISACFSVATYDAVPPEMTNKKRGDIYLKLNTSRRNERRQGAATRHGRDRVG